MINILFFAHLKETLNCEGLQLESGFPATIGDLRHTLGQKGQLWLKTLSNSSTLVAVNQTMANEDTVLNDGDEVAFFPPVTGG